MATKPSINHLRRGATALTTEAGKLIRDRALNAAHQALVVALQSVKAADRKLRGTVSSPRRKASRRTGAAALKRKAARPAAKARRSIAAAASRGKTVRRGRRATR
ncbi:MAG TPA: hypothetical protein VGL83_11415 [Stellaceae bacterium]|jgi:hypothetical protein